MFVNHPELGSFLVAWPLCTVLHMAPSMGKLPAGERAVVHQLLRRAVIGQGVVEGKAQHAQPCLCCLVAPQCMHGQSNLLCYYWHLVQCGAF